LGTSLQAMWMTIWQRTCLHFVYSFIIVRGQVCRTWTISSGGGQLKAAQHSGYGMNIDDYS
jgi:hypothetical protein